MITGIFVIQREKLTNYGVLFLEKITLALNGFQENHEI
jgi:hypothetical protein